MSKQDALDGTALFRISPTFLKGVVAIDGLPAADRPEIAFAGRSNVGKSSLINALTNRKNLARTSNTPGRTQELNFFNFETMNAYLVDMPGYGYAQAPKDLVKGWTHLIKSYLPGRPSLRRTYLLIDSRHGIKANDEEMMKLLDTNAVSFQVILTKIDKLKAGALEKVHERSTELLKKHPAALPNIINTSSQKSIGIDELRDNIATTLG